MVIAWPSFAIKIGLFVKFTNGQKRESHNDGVLFFYTIDFSHSFQIAIFSPWQARDLATADNIYYVKWDWYTLKIDLSRHFLIYLLSFLKQNLKRLKPPNWVAFLGVYFIFLLCTFNQSAANFIISSVSSLLVT